MTATQRWNEGNLEQYLKTYHNSPDTLYITHSLVHGYSQIRENLIHRFPNSKAMGKLTLFPYRIDRLSQDYVLVVGRYYLKQTSGNIFF